MKENDILEGIEIRETLDGVPVDGKAAIRGRAHTAPEAAATSTVSPAGSGTRKTSVKSMRRASRPDPYIWGIYIMLLLISVVELFSASSTEVHGDNVYMPLIRHVIFLGIGLGIVLWLQRTPYMIINRFAWVFAIFSLGLVLLSTVFGESINGAQRAIRVAGVTIQPAEIAKLAVVCLLASIYGKTQTPGGVSNKGVVTSAVVVLVFAACLVTNGLTNTLLLMVVSICMMLIGGIQWKKFGMVMLAYGLAVVLLMGFKEIAPSTADFDNVEPTQTAMVASASNGAISPVQSEGEAEPSGGNLKRAGTWKERINRFLAGVHPDDPITDENRQVVFAKFAQANGGIGGQGPGNSRESARLPLAFSDYIYSIIVEDTGFIGGSLLLLLYLLLVARAGRIAYMCSRAFPAFLIMGCAVMIVFQALVHMAIVTGVFPVSGQPLPFISKGGTSVIVMSAALGIMLSVSRFAAHSGDKKEISAEMNALPDDMQAANYSAEQR